MKLFRALVLALSVVVLLVYAEETCLDTLVNYETCRSDAIEEDACSTSSGWCVACNDSFDSYLSCSCTKSLAPINKAHCVTEVRTAAGNTTTTSNIVLSLIPFLVHGND